MTWREAEGDPVRLLAEAAHASDLVVTSRGGALGTAEQLVTATGVPVLVLPPDAPRDFGRVVLVAWKGSPEAARAVHDALPFLQHAAAKRVVLCAVGEEAAAGLDDAAAMLERHGVPVQPERVDRTDGRSTGEILLAQAAAHGADLLVMGAYGHARLRELVFGGVTRHVLHHATAAGALQRLTPRSDRSMARLASPRPTLPETSRSTPTARSRSPSGWSGPASTRSGCRPCRPSRSACSLAPSSPSAPCTTRSS